MDDTLNDTLNDTLSEPVNKFGLKDEPANEPVNEPVNGPSSKGDPINEPINEPINQNDPINDPINGYAKKKLTERQRTILQFISEDKTISRERLCDYVGLSDSTIKRELAHLQKEGYIHREGSRKTGIWVVNKVNNK